jgi:hypothetical protein
MQSKLLVLNPRSHLGSLDMMVSLLDSWVLAVGLSICDLRGFLPGYGFWLLSMLSHSWVPYGEEMENFKYTPLTAHKQELLLLLLVDTVAAVVPFIFEGILIGFGVLVVGFEKGSECSLRALGSIVR